MKKRLSLILMFLILVPIVFADGGFYVYKDTWLMGDETQQLIAVNYEQGVENLLIAVNVNDDIHGEKAVWIFPVPAKPDDVKIDILKGFPSFQGGSIDDKYDDVVVKGLIISGAYATFPIGVMLTFPYIFLMGGSFGDMKDIGGLGVDVHQSITKMGMTTELITTKDQAALDTYLQAKGLDLPEDSKDIIQEYVGSEYSLVVSYISDLSEFRKLTEEDTLYAHPKYHRRAAPGTPIGVFVSFPTEEIYVPMKLTSIYGEKKIPIFMYILGHVKPNIYSEIKKDTKVRYFEQKYGYTPTPDLAAFFNTNKIIKPVLYTQIEINTESKNFVSDLWMENTVPISVTVKKGLTKIYWLIAMLLYVVFSGLASWFSGLISFKRGVFSRRKLLLHGLWNCLTLVAFAIATGVGLHVDKQNKALDPKLMAKIQEQGLTVTSKSSQRWKYFFLFYIFFFVMLVIEYVFFIFLGFTL